MEIEREYYRFTKLIEDKTFKRSDLIYLGETGKLPFHVVPPGDYKGEWIYWDPNDASLTDDFNAPALHLFEPLGLTPHRIAPSQFLEILHGKAIKRILQKADIEEGMTESQLEFIGDVGVPVRYFLLCEPVLFTEDDLVIMTAHIEPFRQETANPKSISEEKSQLVKDVSNQNVLIMVGALLDYIKNNHTGPKITQAQIADYIEEQVVPGLKKSNINAIFSTANTAYKEKF